MASLDPVDISHFDHDEIDDEIEDEDVKWDDDVIKELERRYEEIRQLYIKYNKSRNEATREEALTLMEVTRNNIEELVANQIYEKLTIMFNNDRKRFSIQKCESILEPIIKYDNFKLADDGKITFVDKRMVINLGNINGRLRSPWEIRKIGVKKLKLMGFVNIMDEDINPYKQKYKRRREEMLKNLDENLDKRSKAMSLHLQQMQRLLK